MSETSILVLNAGSSSVKFALYRSEGEALHAEFSGRAEGLGARPRLSIKDSAGQRRLDTELPAQANQKTALDRIFEFLVEARGGRELDAVGHRVVHGGPRYSAPMRVDAEVLAQLATFAPLAPLHQPHNLLAIELLRTQYPQLPQVACFDTAFHRTQPAVAQRFALPLEYERKGVLRYGFHGLSYEYIAQALPAIDERAAHGRTIVCHLGNGASLCAIEDGRSVASTMGFTALDGLMMGQRCGNIDPGVVLHLLQHEGLTVSQVEDLLYHRSGLLGVSGISADMRELLASDQESARIAIELFVYRVQREIGSMAAALGGVDALVFTAGIGEKAAPVRERICAGLGWLGLTLDPAANAGDELRISTADSRLAAYVIPTDEESMIARHTRQLLAG